MAWSPPPADAGTRRVAFGSSVLDEFVRAHSYVDVLRELVQNEFDAEGTTVQLHFGVSELVVRGAGRPVDTGGWRRLSVVLGTGSVGGSAERIRPKTNSIGSKNFGLRALFLIGDRIHVRSNGLQTMLERSGYSWERPIPDPGTAGTGGAEIIVPYRSTPADGFPAFDETAEAELLAHVKELLPFTVLLLALPSSPRSLQKLDVVSVRLGQHIVWTQTARSEVLKEGIVLVRRRGSLRNPSDTRPYRTIQDLEFRRLIAPPSALRPPSIPGYYLAGRRSVSLGLSVRLRSPGRIDLDHQGSLFYPLEARMALTGCCVSVSAPFEMDADRTQPLPEDASPWNSWLADAVADFAPLLLTRDWYARFGASAYLAWTKTAPASTLGLHSRVVKRLESDRVWPSDYRLRGRPQYQRAEDLLVPGSPQLALLLTPSQRLASVLAEKPTLAGLAISAGSKRFTTSSAVYLRCVGDGKARLKTPLAADEARLVYKAFPDALSSVALQRRFGDAFDSGSLSSAHLADLRAAPTTLTAASTLASGEQLWSLGGHGDLDLIPAIALLHPALESSRSLRMLTRPFKFSDWAREVAQRVLSSSATDEEREALVRLLRSRPTLTRDAWRRLRASPVLRDSMNRWTRPADLLRSQPHLLPFERALHLTAPIDTANRVLLKSLNVRDRLRTTDLIAAVATITDERDASQFEDLLASHTRLLAPTALQRLRSLPILRSTTGGLAAPKGLYVRDAAVTTVLGDHAAYAVGPRTALHRRLGCLAHARADDILGRIVLVRDGTDQANDDTLLSLYTALVDALIRENRPRAAMKDERILRVNAQWVAPQDALVGRRHLTTFGDVLPVVTGALTDVAKSLGASPEPKPTHWCQLIRTYSGRYGSTTALTDRHRSSFRKAMAALRAIPDSIDPADCCLLDRRGFLHRRAAAASRRLLVDDHPAVGAAFEKQSNRHAFIDDSDPATRDYYISASIELLTEVYKPGAVQIGPVVRQPEWLPKLLARIHAPYLPTAVARLMTALGSRRPGTGQIIARKTQAISQIAVVGSLVRSFRLGHDVVLVPISWTTEAGQLQLAGTRVWSEAVNAAAEMLAAAAHPDLHVQRGLVDGIYRLLDCASERMIAKYLESRGARWHRLNETDDDPSADDETLDRMLGDLGTPRGNDRQTPGTTRQSSSREGDDSGTPPPSLPPIEDVSVTVLPSASWAAPRRGGGSASWSGGALGRYRSAEADERDRQLGRRGEQLVLDILRRMVASNGHDPARVVWVADLDETADHDIRSVDCDGEELYIEVKTTMGLHGRFSWPRAEFDLARRKRSRYALWRVYAGHTARPSAREFRDPVGLLLDGSMRLDLERFAAEVAPSDVST